MVLPFVLFVIAEIEICQRLGFSDRGERPKIVWPLVVVKSRA
jgi:hypothetical protein